MSYEQKFEFFAPIWRVMVSLRCACCAVRAVAGGRGRPQQPQYGPDAWPAPMPHAPSPPVSACLQRDSNMSVQEVREQVEYVALVTKQVGGCFAGPGAACRCCLSCVRVLGMPSCGLLST